MLNAHLDNFKDNTRAHSEEQGGALPRRYNEFWTEISESLHWQRNGRILMEAHTWNKWSVVWTQIKNKKLSSFPLTLLMLYARRLTVLSFIIRRHLFKLRSGVFFIVLTFLFSFSLRFPFLYYYLWYILLIIIPNLFSPLFPKFPNDFYPLVVHSTFFLKCFA